MKHRILAKSISLLTLSFIWLTPVLAQDLSIDEAIDKINAEAKATIIGGLQSSDKTGDLQFVDAEISSVHDFNDYTFGSMMGDFEAIMEHRLAVVTSDAASAFWPEERIAIKKENPRLLQYARENMGKIVGYTAIVDFVGITKFRERKNLSMLFYFDYKGNYVDVDSNRLNALLVQITGTEAYDMTDRTDAKKKLLPIMYRRIYSELQQMNDPLFLKKEYWITDLVSDINGNRKFDMQWCYRLTKENTEDNQIDKGHFKAYYYQIQTSLLQTIKMLMVIDGTYEKDKEHIWFSYDSADVKSYHITADATKDFSPGNYRMIDYRICMPQLIESRRAQKFIRAEKCAPTYLWIDENTMKLQAPLISDEPCIFKRK